MDCTDCIDTEQRTCYRCKRKGTRQDIRECCGDCGVSLCRCCMNSNNVQCGCYGECDFCGRDVNRGENGWPCDACEKWLCLSCKYIRQNDCATCNPPDCKNCGEASPSRECVRCKVSGCEECCCYQCQTCNTALCKACIRLFCLTCGIKWK